MFPFLLLNEHLLFRLPLENTLNIFCKVFCFLGVFWSIVELQYCVTFRYSKVNQFYVYFFQIIFYCRLLLYYKIQDADYSSLCHTVNPIAYLFCVLCINPIFPSFNCSAPGICGDKIDIHKNTYY